MTLYQMNPYFFFLVSSRSKLAVLPAGRHVDQLANIAAQRQYSQCWTLQNMNSHSPLSSTLPVAIGCVPMPHDGACRPQTLSLTHKCITSFVRWFVRLSWV